MRLRGPTGVWQSRTRFKTTPVPRKR
ncbi:unnamed protein product [Rhizoctonia solani]|uniref:Uncharacterized protein n=1 Tax=Rhizoctonia solani TaxID=456999 RepID=A0A8H3A706_9AGAM|nr:unnamed protein product [Rhizoctonia solani]